MPILTLKFQERTLEEYRLKAGGTLTIGRMADNDVAIDNLAVSGYHAKIDAAGESFILTDLQSKNGSFVNDEAVTSRRLAHGDVVTIGKHNLVFAFAEGEARPGQASGDLFQTMVMDTDQHRALMERTKRQAPLTQAPSTAVLSCLKGDQGEVGLSKKLFKIGKSIQCDFQVGGLFVGQTAATISQRPDGYYLSYVEGIAKPKVNGTAVKTTVRLNEFDMIEIGNTKMQLVLKKKGA